MRKKKLRRNEEDKRFEIEILKGEIKGLHKYQPRYIFLTETSSIPSGFAIKEAWKNAYPDEEVPKFYRIDPKYIRDCINGCTKSQKKKIENFFKKRIKKRDAPIFIYDEHSLSGESPRIILNLLKNPEQYGFSSDIKCNNVKMVRYHFARMPDKDIIPEIEGLGEIYPGIRLTEKSSNPYEREIVGKQVKRRDLIENCPSGKREVLKSIDYSPSKLIKLYIATGREAGKELRAELESERQNKNSLEQKISVIGSIVGLGAGLFFLSDNITGNVLGNLTKTNSNFIGIGLLIIGLIAGHFYFRKKK